MNKSHILISMILRNEGGYVFDPDDSGKETYCGISRANFPKWEAAKLQELVEEYVLIEKFVCKYGMCLMNIKI